MLLFSLFSTEYAGRMTTKIYSHYCKSWSHIESHGKLGLPLSPVVMNTRCNTRVTESRYAGKLQGIWFYGVCKSLLKNFTSYPFDIECPLSAPPAWLSIDRSFLTPPWTRSSLTIIRCLFYFFSCCACWVPKSHRCTSSAITSSCSWNTRTWQEIGRELERAQKQVGTLSRDTKSQTVKPNQGKWPHPCSWVRWQRWRPQFPDQGRVMVCIPRKKS